MSEPHTDLYALIEASRNACQSWLVSDSDRGLRLVDPVDQKPVIAHYGDSHLAAALIILGQSRTDEAMVEQGLQLVRTVLRDWDLAEGLADFHHDFNNFALCLVVEQLGPEASDVVREIKRVVLRTSDSKHDTVNWLPMRAYVNFSRHEWTGDQKFAVAGRSTLEKVRRATNADGGIEDRLPKGLSYNLQYNVASLAVLMLVSRRWPELEAVPKASLDFLISKMLPDGDVNYMGRGANQIFAWGPWLFALAAAGREEVLNCALDFLDSRYVLSIKQRNLLLNSFLGHEKSFWWDYHYCSVYHAHFLLWSVLALTYVETNEFAEARYQGTMKALPGTARTTTGLKLIGNKAGGAALFAGRSGYLAEAGPTVCGLWLSEAQILFKGGLGPWKGEFGNKYSFADAVFQNHFGLLSQSKVSLFEENRLMRKLFPKRESSYNAVVTPIFSDVAIEQESGVIKIAFETEGRDGYCNAPIFEDQANQVELKFFVDGRRLRQQLMGKSRNQYGWISVFRSELATGRRWEVHIETKRIA